MYQIMISKNSNKIRILKINTVKSRIKNHFENTNKKKEFKISRILSPLILIFNNNRCLIH